MASRREVIYDKTFSAQAKLLIADAKRFDEVMEAAEWKIANHAEQCDVVEGNLRVVHADALLLVSGAKWDISSLWNHRGRRKRIVTHE